MQSFCAVLMFLNALFLEIPHQPASGPPEKRQTCPVIQLPSKRHISKTKHIDQIDIGIAQIYHI